MFGSNLAIKLPFWTVLTPNPGPQAMMRLYQRNSPYHYKFNSYFMEKLIMMEGSTRSASARFSNTSAIMVPESPITISNTCFEGHCCAWQYMSFFVLV